MNYNSFNDIGWLSSLSEAVRSRFEVVLGDVRDLAFMVEALRGHDRVIHLAALIAIPYSYRAPWSYLETNVMGTMNVMEASRQNGVERVVHTSTSEVYGSAQYVPIDERHPQSGQSPYSASKIGADQVAFSYWASFSLPVVTVRPFNAYGPRQSMRAFIPTAIVQLLSGSSQMNLGSLSPTRDLTFVEDTARGFLTVLESDFGLGETFNMGSGFEISMGEVLDILRVISNSSFEVVEDRSRIRPQASEVERLWSDNSKIFETFGWSAGYSNVEGLALGLEKTYRWFRENNGKIGHLSTGYVV